MKKLLLLMLITPLIGFGQTPSIEVTKTWTLENDLDNNNIVNVGDQIKFIISVKNDGNETLTNIGYDDTFLDGSTPPNLLSFDSPNNPRTLTWIASDGGSFEGMLNAGETAIYHAYYTITQAVYDSGEVTNTVTFFGEIEGTNNLVEDVSDNGNDIDGNPYDDITRISMGVQHGNMTDIILNGSVSVENNQIRNVADPTHNQDAVTLKLLLKKIKILQEQIDVLNSNFDYGTVSDQEGNSYPYVTYGDQLWTIKNAEMETYRDGTPIPEVNDINTWKNLKTGAWCYYDNDPSKGKLYNWYAVMGIHDDDESTPNKEFAPEGWHVPTDAEWTTLENYLIANGYNYDGTTTSNEIAKAMASTTGWNESTNTGAIGNDQSLNNGSLFNALPVGYRAMEFSSEGINARFWSSTEHSTDSIRAYYQKLNYSSSSTINFSASKWWGFSVRFVKNN